MQRISNILVWGKRARTSCIHRNEYCKHTFSTKSTSPRLFERAEEDGNQKISFIEKARAMGANALLGLYTHTGDRFDQCLKANLYQYEIIFPSSERNYIRKIEYLLNT